MKIMSRIQRIRFYCIIYIFYVFLQAWIIRSIFVIMNSFAFLWTIWTPERKEKEMENIETSLIYVCYCWMMLASTIYFFMFFAPSHDSQVRL